MELIKPIKETLSERTHHQSANSNVLQKDADGISLGRYLAYRPANMGLRIEAFENLKIGIQKVHASMTACIDLYFCPAAVHMYAATTKGLEIRESADRVCRRYIAFSITAIP